MKVQTQAQVTIKADITQVFDYSIDCQNLPMLFTGYQSIPAIVRVQTSDGLPLREGGTRIVANSDGSLVEEVITVLQRPHTQQYRLIKGLKPPFSWLVRSAIGHWRYETVPSGTQVTWQFEFETFNVLAGWLVQLVVKTPFQKAQAACLEKLNRQLSS